MQQQEGCKSTNNTDYIPIINTTTINSTGNHFGNSAETTDMSRNDIHMSFIKQLQSIGGETILAVLPTWQICKMIQFNFQ